jgi:hypothetical protein
VKIAQPAKFWAARRDRNDGDAASMLITTSRFG